MGVERQRPEIAAEEERHYGRCFTYSKQQAIYASGAKPPLAGTHALRARHKSPARCLQWNNKYTDIIIYE